VCGAALPAFSGDDDPDVASGRLFAKATNEQPSAPPASLSPPDPLQPVNTDRINGVIYPFRAATVGSEVRGIVDLINAKEGQPVKEGDVIAEISKARYEAIVGEFRGNYDAVVRTLERAKEDLALQERLYERRAATFDDLSKARSQARILESRKEEAEHKLKQAELNLKACVLTAPFTGNITVLYHEPAEPVDNLEKVFGVIDTSKVYARVNWPEARLSELAVGKKAVFHYDGKTYEGTVDKIASLIDPGSKSKRIHILIDNPDGRLQVGMSGAVNLVEGKEPRKVSAR
jgi:RND family efflux transporter MFP subunit